MPKPENLFLPKGFGYHDEAYLAFIRQIPCCVCAPFEVTRPWFWQDGEHRSDPDHLPVRNMRVRKVPDPMTAPLCREHHELRERTVLDVATKRLLGVNLAEVAMRLMWAYFYRRPADVPLPMMVAA